MLFCCYLLTFIAIVWHWRQVHSWIQRQSGVRNVQLKASESSVLPAPGARNNGPHMHEGKETINLLPRGRDNIASLEISPFLQLFALLLGSWEDHGQVWSIHLKKDAVLRACDIGERGWVLQFLVLVIREAFLRARPRRTASLSSWAGYSRRCPQAHPA